MLMLISGVNSTAWTWTIFNMRLLIINDTQALYQVPSGQQLSRIILYSSSQILYPDMQKSVLGL